MTQTQTITVQAIFETVYTVYFKHDGRTVATKELTDTQPSVSTGDVLIPVGAFSCQWMTVYCVLALAFQCALSVMFSVSGLPKLNCAPLYSQ